MPHTDKDTPDTSHEIIQPTLLDDLENRSPDPAEIWYAHSILTTTLYPATPPPPGTDYVSKTNGNLEYLLEAGIDPLNIKIIEKSAA